jgi:hypothetical protein
MVEGGQDHERRHSQDFRLSAIETNVAVLDYKFDSVMVWAKIIAGMIPACTISIVIAVVTH